MLRAPDVLGPSETQNQQIQSEWSTFNYVQGVVSREGFTPLPAPPHACPGYVDFNVLDTHDSRTLIYEFVKYKAWRDYSANRLIYCKQILLEVQKQMRRIESACKTELARRGNKKPTKDDIVELAQTTEPYNELEKQEQIQKQLSIEYETREDEFDKSVQLISRVITIRGQDIEQGNRGGTIGANSLPERGFK